MGFIGRIIINSLLFIAIVGFFQESFYVASVGTAVLAAIVLALLNTLIKPFLVLLTLPLNILTLGLFSIVLNGFMLELTSWVIGNNFQFASFGMAMLVALIMSVCNVILSDF